MRKIYITLYNCGCIRRLKGKGNFEMGRKRFILTNSKWSCDICLEVYKRKDKYARKV